LLLLPGILINEQQWTNIIIIIINSPLKMGSNDGHGIYKVQYLTTNKNSKRSPATLGNFSDFFVLQESWMLSERQQNYGKCQIVLLSWQWKVSVSNHR
jgi:hypothetical protein